MMPERTESWRRRESGARKYQPRRIRLLLIAESPTADQGFFYAEAGPPNLLFQEVCQVLFEATPGEEKVPFLKELRRRGIFLVDLKPDAPRRSEALGPYVGPLLINLGTLGAEGVILVHEEVYDAAHAKMEAAGVPVVDVRIPFPVPDQPEIFRQKFRQALVHGGLEKLIRPLPTPKAER